MSKLVLIVDDSHVFREMLKSFLTKRHYKTELCASSSKAFKKILAKDYDLVVVEYFMSELDGLELLEKIKSIKPNLPVIFVASDGNPEIVVKAMKLGAEDYLPKTEDFYQSFIETVENIFSSKMNVSVKPKVDDTEDDKLLNFPYKILVVDDSPLVLEMVKSKLEQENFIVDTSKNGFEALNKIDKSEYDLALIDYAMPKMDGLKLLKKILQLKYNLPSIIFTSYGSETGAIQAMKYGALDYVQKDIGYLDLLPRIIRDNLYTYRASLPNVFDKKDIISLNEKILVIDDSQVAREQITKILKNSDYEVITAVSAEDGLHKFSQDKFDLMILDYHMPKLNGIQLLKALKENEMLTIPIIMCTGKGSETTAVEAFQLGVKDYIIKTPGYLDCIPDIVRKNLAVHRLENERKLLEQKLINKNLDLEKRTKQIQALNDIIKRMSENLDPSITLTTIVSKISIVLNCNRVSIMLLDDGKKFLTIKAAKGFPRTEIANVCVPFGKKISGYVTKNGKSLLIPNIEVDPLFKKKSEKQYFSKSLLTVPLKFEDRIMGVINVNNKKNNDDFSIDDLNILTTISYSAAMAINNSNKYQEAKKSAATDDLTSLYNRRYFERTLTREIERSKRYKNELFLLILDIDDFKKINDNYGHTYGDLVLKEISQLLKTSIRRTEILSRFGGEEFSIIFSQNSFEEVYKSCERLRCNVEKYKFSDKKLKKLKISISLGLSKYNSKQTKNQLIQHADKVLYEAKKSGKNRICVYK